MKRFFALYILGALLMAGGLLALITGLHPDHFAPFAFLAKGGASLVLGASLLTPGLLGMAENCEESGQRVRRLLADKEISPDLDLEFCNIDLRDEPALDQCQQRFWNYYHRAAWAIGAFVFSFLLLSVLLNSLSFIAYLSSLALACGILAPLAIALTASSLISIWRLLQGMDAVTFVLEEEPDRQVAPPVPRRWSPRPTYNIPA
jgi:hypothetical protein